MENVEVLLTDPKIVKALAHPVRAKLLTILDGREASPNQLSKEIEEPLGTVSYHVRKLHNMGLLRLVAEKRQRGAVEHYYTGVKWLIHENAWNTLPESLRGILNQSFFSQIGEDISAAAASDGFDQPYSLLNRDVLTLDGEGAIQLAREVSALAQRALAIEVESRERFKEGEPGEQENVHLVMMLFGAPGEKEQ